MRAYTAVASLCIFVSLSAFVFAQKSAKAPADKAKESAVENLAILFEAQGERANGVQGTKALGATADLYRPERRHAGEHC